MSAGTSRHCIDAANKYCAASAATATTAAKTKIDGCFGKQWKAFIAGMG